METEYYYVGSYAVRKFHLEQLAKTGSREDFLVHISGSTETPKISISDTLIGMWGDNNEEVARSLIEQVFIKQGTPQHYPSGYSFDSYNSASTLRETLNLIINDSNNLDGFKFAADRSALGAGLYSKCISLDETFAKKFGKPFFKPLDILFEPNRAIEDMSSDAKDDAHLLFRICILSGIIDRFDFEIPNSSQPSSLDGLLSWLSEKLGVNEAEEKLKSFRMIKRLRRQYPIHEQYYQDNEGNLQRKRAVIQAEEYFGFRTAPNDTVGNWHKVMVHFSNAIDELHGVIATIKL